MKLYLSGGVIVSALLLACQNQVAAQAPGEEKPSEIHSPKGLRPGYTAPPPPPIPSDEGDKPASKEKIEKELQEHKLATRRAIEENLSLPKPTYEVDTAGAYLVDEIKKFGQLDCSEAAYANLAAFRQTFTDSFPYSSGKTGRYDGGLFCIRTFETSPGFTTKIIYRRSEGGHVDDGIELVILSDRPGAICRLPLFHHFGKEGYDIVIESEIDGRLIRRKIVERLGWTETLEEQPVSETIQEFEMQEDGAIILIKEKTVNFNFDRYVE